MSTTIAPTQTHALRGALEWTEARDWPEGVVVHVAGNVGRSRATVSVHVMIADDLPAARRAVGPMTKESTRSSGLLLVADPTPTLHVDLYPPTGTCRQVETGEVETYEEVVEPAKTRTATRAKMEWRCPPSVLSEDEVLAGEAAEAAEVAAHDAASDAA